ncbi:MAG: Nif3-like dinuclear metal center hexameric protein [bacterium]|jgi:dinuclear metal center YbgI/SA1388 family protein
MAVKASYVTSLIEELAPKRLAEDWDNVGWQVGDSRSDVTTVLVSLDPSPGALAEAKRLQAELLITHHPLLFRPLKRLRLDVPAERLIAQFLEAGVNVYTAHTNLDNAPQGTSQVLANKLGLTDTEVLVPGQRQKLYKIVTFVPPSHVGNVRQALAAAGAGWIGNYSHCTFQVAGKGTFLPFPGTNPHIGQPGVTQCVDELRLETIVAEEHLGLSINRMLAAHPYEEVAYDVYPLVREGQVYGLGRVGTLPKKITLVDLCQRIKEALELPIVTVTGDKNKPIHKVAVCGGSGSSLVGRAHFVGADVLVTGDVKYHDAMEADLLGLSLVDAGHAGTENPVVLALKNYLTAKLTDRGVKVQSYIAPPISYGSE